jgi:HK97 gp10 family phage protein
MVTHVTFTMKGFDEYKALLDKTEKEIDNAAYNAVRAGANVLRAGMRRRAPVKTGRLKNHIRIKLYRVKGHPYADVGLIHEKDFTPADVARYGNVQEYGSADTPAHPFIRPTIAEDAGAARQAMRDSLIASGIIEVK